MFVVKKLVDIRFTHAPAWYEGVKVRVWVTYLCMKNALCQNIESNLHAKQVETQKVK